MNVLQATEYIIQAWEETTPATIRNCWHHTKILSTNADFFDDAQETDNSMFEELAETLNALHLPNQMGVNEFLTVPDENTVYEVPEEDRLIKTHLEGRRLTTSMKRMKKRMIAMSQ